MKLALCGYYGYDEMNGSDSREDIWKEQREKFGFDDTETYSLGDTIVEFSLPRLKRFMEIEKETNSDWDKVEKYYTELVEGLELFIRNDGNRMWTDEESKKVDNALKSFGEMLPGMWW